MKRIATILAVLVVSGLAANAALAQTAGVRAATQLGAAAMSYDHHWDRHREWWEHHAYPGQYGYLAPGSAAVYPYAYPVPVYPPPVVVPQPYPSYYYAPPVNPYYYHNPRFSIGIGF